MRTEVKEWISGFRCQVSGFRRGGRAQRILLCLAGIIEWIFESGFYNARHQSAITRPQIKTIGHQQSNDYDNHLLDMTCIDYRTGDRRQK